jgi:hypothetical protein
VEQINATAGWKRSVAETYYMTQLPIQAMRILSGADREGSYRIPRAMVEPPPSCRDELFFGLNTYLDLVKSQEITDIATRSFIELLDDLRTVLLQDSVVLKKKFPELHVWKFPVFQSKAYLTWAEEATQALSEIEKSFDEKYRINIPPALIDSITSIRDELARSRCRENEHEQRLLEFKHEVTEMKNEVMQLRNIIQKRKL